ncbi:helix-turn-helix domain-containing protein [Lactococcus lactis]|uniref:helix-turn-helix domain-containing protein n=1 Tax=Lactococcus lactis TaxID=1358 RepID=UPI0032E51FDB
MALLTKDNIFYCRLLEQMELVHKTADEVETELGISKAQFTDYEKGVLPTVPMLIRCSTYFKVTPEYLLGRESDLSDTLLENFFDSLAPQQKAKVYSLCREWFNEYKV